MIPTSGEYSLDAGPELSLVAVTDGAAPTPPVWFDDSYEDYEDDDFEEAIGELWEFVKSFDPKLYGYEWAENDAPRFQLAPLGYRGYIEAKPVRAINA